MPPLRRSRTWLLLQLGIGLAWILILLTQAGHSSGHALSPGQVGLMLMLAGWVPSIPLALWQRRHPRWRALILSDLLGAGVLVLLACTAYLPLFFVNVVWFLPLALLPRGVVAEILMQLLNRRSSS